MIGITAATSRYGSKVIAGIVSKGFRQKIVGIARNPGTLANLGIEARQADYEDLPALKDAFAGLDTLLLISSNSPARRAIHHDNLIEAAIHNDVKHIVYTSILHADRLDCELASDHLLTERKLQASGIKVTVLRNGWYWENHTDNLSRALQYGAMVGSAGAGRISWASRHDLAEAAIAVLTNPGYAGAVYELAGDSAYTLNDLATEAALISGKPLAVHMLNEDAHAKFYESVGLDSVMAHILAEVEAKCLGSGLLEDNSGTLSQLIGRPTTTLQEAVEKALQS